MKQVFVLNGPNLNLLGVREPDIYGKVSLAELEEMCVQWGRDNGLDVICHQSNHEGELVTWVQEAGAKGNSIVLNAGAYTHTSIALADAVKGSGALTLEVHISNIHARENFRHHSYLSPVCAGSLVGLGLNGYKLALIALANMANH